jgi:hypothetical protein
MRRLISGIALGLALAAVSGACARLPGARYEKASTTTASVGQTADVGVFEMKAGDCVDNLPSEDGTVLASVAVVPCVQPHEAEVYAAYDLTLETFPGDDQLSEIAAQGCIDRVPSTIESQWGVNSTYGPFVLQPTRETWKLGDREVLCLVVRVDGGDITGDLL